MIFASLKQTLFLDIETSSTGKIFGLGAIFGDRTPLRANNAQAVANALQSCDSQLAVDLESHFEKQRLVGNLTHVLNGGHR